MLGLKILAVAALYFVAANGGIFTRPLGGPVSSLWIPAGVAVVCLLMLGPQVWPGIALAAFVAYIPELPLLAALLVAVGNTLAPVCAYLLLRRANFRVQLDRLRDALALVFLAAFGAMAISATIGSTALIMTGVSPPEDYLQVWMVWWSSDALGVLVLTPLLLLLRNPLPARQVDWHRWVEFAALLVVTLALTTVATMTFGFLFLAFPLVVWAAWRFQLPGVAPCALIVTGVAINAAAHGYGLFAGRGLVANLLILQVFNGSIVLTGLVLSVAISAWKQSRSDIEQACLSLSEAVSRMQQSMLPGSGYLSTLRNKPHISGGTRVVEQAREPEQPAANRADSPHPPA